MIQKTYAERKEALRLKAEKAAEKQKRKFGNTPSLCVSGHSHRSKLESVVCGILKGRQDSGEIRIDQVEEHIKLSDAEIVYIADWKCWDVQASEPFWVEAKGFESQRWPIILKLWRHYGPGRLEIWRGDHSNPFLHETVIPRRRGGV